MTTDAIVAVATLTAMEVVLGLDNIIFISILAARLPLEQQNKARQLGLGLALVMRLGLLFSLSWVMSLTEPLLHVSSKAFSGRDLILTLGGLFLLAKATYEIHHKLEGEEPTGDGKAAAGAVFSSILIQILLLDIVFSLDSVIMAVGMAQEIWVMAVAMVLSVIVMLFSAKPLSDFVDKHPTIKILALAFLLLIGVTLLIEGMGGHVSKAYIYFAMAFSLGVEMLNMRARKKSKPVKLHSQAP
jgi:predicted tellurium resistance membrane protein TerC